MANGEQMKSSQLARQKNGAAGSVASMAAKLAPGGDIAGAFMRGDVSPTGLAGAAVKTAIKAAVWTFVLWSLSSLGAILIKLAVLIFMLLIVIAPVIYVMDKLGLL